MGQRGRMFRRPCIAPDFFTCMYRDFPGNMLSFTCDGGSRRSVPSVIVFSPVDECVCMCVYVSTHTCVPEVNVHHSLCYFFFSLSLNLELAISATLLASKPEGQCPCLYLQSWGRSTVQPAWMVLSSEDAFSSLISKLSLYFPFLPHSHPGTQPGTPSHGTWILRTQNKHRGSDSIPSHSSPVLKINWPWWM